MTRDHQWPSAVCNPLAKKGNQRPVLLRASVIGL